MRTSIYICCFTSLIFITNIYGQRKHLEKTLIENSKCTELNRYSLSKRLAFYPFSVAKSIALISFDDPKMDENAIPIRDKILDMEKVKEFLILKPNEIGDLTHIIYNYGQNDKFPKYGVENYKCYNPRNAILFLGDKNEVVEYIEICFQCYGIKLSSDNIKTWPECSEKLNLIKNYFIKAKIRVGTNAKF
ncbi:hypothetical protein [Flavobacterium selenitireducens]|uniref:hypothetical protein n=1 Tax=Flavobacterium selenitireducens TaxID=2722704 RepID=UPI00168B48B2|nr:hypothetical protein [Flavobacterium selenitireducens]MBD3584053.1 hypothetical protein [Flavobacterium selenitireducens]